jgi:hypothetical protein
VLSVLEQRQSTDQVTCFGMYQPQSLVDLKVSGVADEQILQPGPRFRRSPFIIGR